MTNTDKAIVLYDFEYCATPILDPTQDYELAKIGDSFRRQVIRESTFSLLSPDACAIVDKVPTGLTTA